MSGHPICCGMEPASAEWIATAVFGEPREPKPKEGARISQPRSTERDSAGCRTANEGNQWKLAKTRNRCAPAQRQSD